MHLLETRCGRGNSLDRINTSCEYLNIHLIGKYIPIKNYTGETILLLSIVYLHISNFPRLQYVPNPIPHRIPFLNH